MPARKPKTAALAEMLRRLHLSSPPPPRQAIAQ